MEITAMVKALSTVEERSPLTKTLRIMKIIAVLLLTIALHASAGSYSQQVTLKLQNAPLKTAFAQLEAQTGYFFTCTDEVLKNTGSINADIKNISLSSALDMLLKPLGLAYTYKGKFIIIAPPLGPSIPIEKENNFTLFPIKGTVKTTSGQPLVGASISIKSSNVIVVSDANGNFEINASIGQVLVISYVGFDPQEVKVSGNGMILVALRERIGDIDSVTIVSNGYQDINKDRAPGSFVKIDNELLNRKVSPNILDRIYEITPGLNFQPRSNGKTNIQIRGNSTINANRRPLVVIDGFPYEEVPGDDNTHIRNINPNDIENITILKDASASSIWGARAGNGVIVITTKQGRFNQPTTFQFNSNVTIGSKPDLSYIPSIPSGDIIELEKKLFILGFYPDNSASGNFNGAYSNVVELLIAKNKGQISGADADAQIESLKKYNIKNDIDKYLLQNSIQQQYAFNISGGSDKVSYYGSLGYDESENNSVGDKSKRFTTRFENTIRPIKNLTVNGFLVLNQYNNLSNGIGFEGFLPHLNTPYTRLADDNGNALAIPFSYRMPYVDTIRYPNLLDWHYRPLDELRNKSNTQNIIDYRLGGTVKYGLLPGLTVEGKYQFQKRITLSEVFFNTKTYEVRNLINQFISFSSNDGRLYYPIPLGAILDKSVNESNRWNFRGQVSYNKNCRLHSVTAIGGYEATQYKSKETGNRFYGYDEESGTYVTNMNFDSIFQIRPGGQARIPSNVRYSPKQVQRFLDYYSNIAYTYKSKYTLSGSVRFDGSNFFGIKANQRIVPLWSSGILWDISKEEFFKTKWLPYLKLRATYGYNGNMYNGVGAYTTISYGSSQSLINLPFAVVSSPPNPELRWEKVKMFNIGIDFATKGESISGSIEYYHKTGIDLIGPLVFEPTTGVLSITGNGASIKGKGVDILINSINIDSKFKWNTQFIFAFNTDKVTVFQRSTTVASHYLGSNPIIGKPLNSLFSYAWGGLDPLNGDPRGIISDTIVSFNTAVAGNNTKPTDLIFHGAVTPRLFGSLRNDFGFRNISLSINLTYKLNYYFRRTSVDYSTLFFRAAGHPDYLTRWKAPDDENVTNVPSMPSFTNSSRDQFYSLSEILVEKGDHIRLQDIKLSYSLDGNRSKKFFTNTQLYLYANNLGILWRANDKDIDPDFGDQALPNPKTFSIGVTLGF